MSRVRHYTRSLASGYAAFAANIVFSLVSVPLALHYLSKAEFGLWALTTQIAGFIGLVDLGMAGAISRIIIDYKEDRASGDYGSVIKTGFLVNAAQGIVVLLLSLACAWLLVPWLEIGPELEHNFRWLLAGQGVMLAATFATRMWMHVLVAHQRYDVVNSAQTLSFAVNLAAAWVSLRAGHGVYSILWGQGAGFVMIAVIQVWGCARLKLLPAPGHWGGARWDRFLELFHFGKDVFLFSVGSQLIFASQTILITRLLGLEMGAVWSVCSRTFTLGTQLIYRVFDFSCPVLAEMMVRGERDRLLQRFRAIAVLTTSLGLLGGVLLVAANGSFVAWWTGGRMQWPRINDLLLAGWLVVCVIGHAHVGLVGQTKNFRFLRFVYLLEGLLFVGLSLLTMKRGGLTAMLGASLFSSLLCSFPYGIHRTVQHFGLKWSEVLGAWSRPGLRLALIMTPLALVVCWMSRTLNPAAQFGVLAAALGLPGLVILLGWGVETRFKQEVIRRGMVWWKARISMRREGSA